MKIFKFFWWKFIDIYRFFKYRKNRKVHLYGIYGYFGLPGAGKTMCMSQELISLREKYKDKIYIFTNYGFKYEDAPFTHWKMLLKTYDKPCVFAWDEVQNEFNSRDFKSFPVELLTLLTQNRKGNGKRILYTAQRYSRVDKVFRELSVLVGECHTLFGRYTRVRFYDTEDYENLLSVADVNKRIKIKSRKRVSFIQTDDIRNCYDSFQMLETAKKRQYIDKRDIKIEGVKKIL